MKPSEKLSLLTRKQFVPLMAVFELTRRCNLKCRHCYIDPPKGHKGELPTARIKNILSQLAKTGCLNLVFTGGEIFLRKDALELCKYARQKGFDLRIFTNGTFIDYSIAKTLSLIGVSGVEISLYGKQPAHENVTRIKGSFSKALYAIASLKKYKVPVTIKCPLMKHNFVDYRWLMSFAKKQKINVRFDPTISPKDDGDTKILKYRLTTRQLKSAYADPLLNQDIGISPKEADFSCSAGVNMLTIGFDGTVYPCLQYLIPLGNLKNRKLEGIWNLKNRRLSKLRGLTISDFPECLKCKKAPICQRCPGIALLEDKTLTGSSKIACKIARIKSSL